MLQQNCYATKDLLWKGIDVKEIKEFEPGLLMGMNPILRKVLKEKNLSRILFEYLSDRDLSRFMKTSRLMCDKNKKEYFEERKELKCLKQLLLETFIADYEKYRELALQHAVAYLEIEIPKKMIKKLTIVPLCKEKNLMLLINSLKLKIRKAMHNVSTARNLKELRQFRKENLQEFYEHTNEFGFKKKLKCESFFPYSYGGYLDENYPTNLEMKTLKLKIESTNKIEDLITVFDYKCPLGKHKFEVVLFNHSFNTVILSAHKNAKKCQIRGATNYYTPLELLKLFQKFEIKFNLQFIKS
jgi:hypothetical protein